MRNEFYEMMIQLDLHNIRTIINDDDNNNSNNNNDNDNYINTVQFSISF